MVCLVNGARRKSSGLICLTLLMMRRWKRERKIHKVGLGNLSLPRYDYLPACLFT